MNAEINGQVVILRGRFDTTGAARAREALEAALAAGGGPLYVDVSSVEVIDLVGLGVLVGAHRRAERAGRRLVLRDVPPGMVRALRLTRLDRIVATERTPVPA